MVNLLLLIMGVVVFKSGVVKDFLFFGFYEVLFNILMLSNGILISVVKFGVFLVFFVIVLLVFG